MGKFDLELEKDLRKLLNVYSQENASDTPDFVLAKYLLDCLEAYNNAVEGRRKMQEGYSVRKDKS